MKKVIIYILIIAILSTMLVGCNKNIEIVKPEHVSRGEVVDGYYVNEDMGFKIKVPENYYTATEEELDTKFDIKQHVEDDELEVFITYLAFFSQKPVDDAQDNSHIMISVEDASKYGYSDKDTYIEYMSNSKADTYRNIEGAKITLSNQTNVWLGNRKFANRTLTLDLHDLYMIFDMYAVVKNGYFLSITITASPAEWSIPAVIAV
jgi:nucleoside diphosphate kinase